MSREATAGQPGSRLRPVDLVIGLVTFGLMLIAVTTLWFNEWFATQRAEAIEHAGGDFKVVDPEVVKPQNEGRLVYVTGEARTRDLLMDPLTGYSIRAMALVRVVEMYQWRENEVYSSHDGGVSCTYSPTWSTAWFDSSGFRGLDAPSNPPMPLRRTRIQAHNVKVGAFSLSSLLVARLAVPFVHKVSVGDAELIGAALGRPAHWIDGAVYLGADPERPAIGDLVVRYRVAPASRAATVVARQSGDTFVSYETNGGRDVMEIERGTVMGIEMIAAPWKGASRHWTLRLVGTVLVLLGLWFFSSRGDRVAAVFPVLKPLLEGGWTVLCLGVGLSVAVIGLAWLLQDLLLGLILLLMAGYFTWCGVRGQWWALPLLLPVGVSYFYHPLVAIALIAVAGALALRGMGVVLLDFFLVTAVALVWLMTRSWPLVGVILVVAGAVLALLDQRRSMIALAFVGAMTWMFMMLPVAFAIVVLVSSAAVAWLFAVVSRRVRLARA